MSFYSIPIQTRGTEQDFPCATTLALSTLQVRVLAFDREETHEKKNVVDTTLPPSSYQ